ncbi:MAG TPA: 4Fe-4S ferredoxin [Bacteroidales bacterium]|nr:4Fe-4S ferredoxin [Bacteroidales bacterium]
MALMIGSECMSCGLCIEECPNDAIYESSPVYIIDPDLCTECVGVFDEPQCVRVCPMEVIIPNPDYDENQEQLLEKERRILGSRDPDQ